MRPTFNSVAQWQQNVDELRLFSVLRPAAATRHVLDHFGLSGTSQISLALHIPDSAVLQINGKALPDAFQGTYFNDIPLVVRATPRSGYTFSHWEIPSMVAPSESIVPTGSVWRYLDTGVSLGAEWRQKGYDDSAWPTGAAQLGYGDEDEATVVGYGGAANNKYITTYFRKSFVFTDVAHFRSYSVSLLVDDGAVAYLNGQEIARVNMPSGRIASTTTASQAIADENSFTKFPVPSAYLQSGVNTLAVEIHQAGSNSPDLSFDCSFSGETLPVAQTIRIDTPQIKITLSSDTQLTAFLDATSGVSP